METNMAMVTITGWLDDDRQLQWGRVLKVGIDVNRKNNQDQWEKVDKTVYEIKTDSQTPLEGVKQVTVVGRIMGTSTFTKRDNTTGSAIRVTAESVRPAGEKVQEAAINAVWPTVNPGQGKVEDATF
jgi:hypothetical protein